MEGDGVGGGSLEGDVGGGSNVEIMTLIISQKIGKAEVGQIRIIFSDCYQNYVDSVDCAHATEVEEEGIGRTYRGGEFDCRGGGGDCD